MSPARPRAPLPNARVVAIPVAYNEEHAIGSVLDRFAGVAGVDVAVVDDGSTDRTAAIVEERGATLIHRPVRGGAGAAIRTAYRWAREQGYDICVILAGNDKDRPDEIPRLLTPILSGAADLVQGSRYLPGGSSHHIPAYRAFATRIVHPRLFSLAVGRRMTDTTNGFRALRLAVLDDPRINLNADWLDKYELEPYLLYSAVRYGYAVLEVPVTKTYPVDGRPYTKMQPVSDWWRILRPIILLRLGWRR